MISSSIAETDVKCTDFDLVAIKKGFRGGLWPTFPTTLMTVQASSKADDNTIDAEIIPVPMLVWPEQRPYMKCHISQNKQSPSRDSRKRKFQTQTVGEKVEHLGTTLDVDESASIYGKRQRRNEEKTTLSTISQWICEPTSTLFSFFCRTFGSASSNSTDSLDRDAEHRTITEDHPHDAHSLIQGNSVESVLHQQAFDRFHGDGFMVGPGDVYGGDFVLYKDRNPASTHSVATVLVHDSQMILPKDLLSFGRVQNQVAKSAVIVFPTDCQLTFQTSDFVVINFRKVAVRI